MITYALLAIIVIFSIGCFNNEQKMYKYMFHPYSIYHNREHYRFLTHAFIHGDMIHLVFNCLALYGFGLQLEYGYFPNEHLFGPKWGEVYYLLLFTGGIYAASVTEYFRQRNNPNYYSLGASGAISAIVFCSIIINPTQQVDFFFIPMPGWIMGVLLIGLSMYLSRRKRVGAYSDSISHEAHFWGAIFGVAFILALKPFLFKRFLGLVFGTDFN